MPQKLTDRVDCAPMGVISPLQTAHGSAGFSFHLQDGEPGGARTRDPLIKSQIGARRFKALERARSGTKTETMARNGLGRAVMLHRSVAALLRLELPLPLPFQTVRT